ncbi:MAG: hypothetical protein KIT45_06755 [Fimbriimonadia bacterium]|nr:hypothetical protein [Fimbriimonadia bacterium]
MFNPRDHLIKVKGGQEYLPVSARLVWFRDERPEWSIETEPHLIDLDKRVAVFRSTVRDEQGRVIATATKMETGSDFGDFLEKAETGSVGRALAMCGFGTQFAPELLEGERLVDSPPPNANNSIDLAVLRSHLRGLGIGKLQFAEFKAAALARGYTGSAIYQSVLACQSNEEYVALERTVANGLSTARRDMEESQS